MTQLEQYKRAYATLLGEVDTIITSLEGTIELQDAHPPEDPQLLMMGAFTRSMVLGLTKAIQNAEEVFLAEDAKEEQ